MYPDREHRLNSFMEFFLGALLLSADGFEDNKKPVGLMRSGVSR
jgi:hypothetical protein